VDIAANESVLCIHHLCNIHVHMIHTYSLYVNINVYFLKNMLHFIRTNQRPTDQRPTAQHSTDERPTAQRPTGKRPTNKRPTEKRPTEKRPTYQRPTDQRSTDRAVYSNCFTSTLTFCLRGYT